MKVKKYKDIIEIINITSNSIEEQSLDEDNICDNWGKKKEFIEKLSFLQQEYCVIKFEEKNTTCILCSHTIVSHVFVLKSTINITWPGNLIHYIENHHYKPSDDFVTAILREYEHIKSKEDDEDDYAPRIYKKEGFFNANYIPVIKKFKDKKVFLQKLGVVEKDSEDSYIKGSFYCVFCNEKISGSMFRYEIENENWDWPNNYRHYIEKHGVHPSDEFIIFINKAYNIITNYIEKKEYLSLKEIKDVIKQATNKKFISAYERDHILDLFTEIMEG